MDADAEQRWLSTGEAAKLCSVERDTVLKWIKRGRLRASRTAGGHYRIDFQDLQRVASASSMREEGVASAASPLRCWEYLSADGEVREECKNCMAYRVGATWCFSLRELEGENSLSFCCGPDSCEDCSYYRRVKGLTTRVLVITGDEALRQSLGREKSEDLALCFARTGYEAATTIFRFRPGIAVVDAEVDRDGGGDLVENLASDPRNHGLKIVYAVPARHTGRREGSWPGRAVVASLQKPFGPAELEAVVQKFHIEVPGAGQAVGPPSFSPTLTPGGGDRGTGNED